MFSTSNKVGIESSPRQSGGLFMLLQELRTFFLTLQALKVLSLGQIAARTFSRFSVGNAVDLLCRGRHHHFRSLVIKTSFGR
jgi:hypothetical protein